MKERQRAQAEPGAASLTCRGCHLGKMVRAVPQGGRRGAPRPQHAGIPPVHFEKLSCTACHSGPWPSDNVMRVKTSRAHGLGIPKINKADDALPHVVTPVYAKQAERHVRSAQSVLAGILGDTSGTTPCGLSLPETVRPLLRGIFERDTLEVLVGGPCSAKRDVLAILHQLHRARSTQGNTSVCKCRKDSSSSIRMGL